jgi:restriction endonuclease Mrr
MDNNIFEKLYFNNPVEKISTEKFLTEYYKTQGFNVFKSSEFAQNTNSNFVEFVNQSIQSSHQQNIPDLFKLVTREIILFNSEFPLIKQIHHNLLQMEWRDFELISSVLLEVCFGGIDVKTTQASGDGGLDFEGKIPVKSILSDNTYGYIEVYGQSKKHTGSVGIYDVKSFVAYANSKKRNYVHPAQIFMFFTTSQFVSNALKELAENHFLGFSGFQLADLIFHHKEILVERSDLFKPLLSL